MGLRGCITDRVRVLDGTVHIKCLVHLLGREEGPEIANHGRLCEGPSIVVYLGGDVERAGGQDDLKIVPRPRVEDGPLADFMVEVLEHILEDRMTLWVNPVCALYPAWVGSKGL